MSFHIFERTRLKWSIFQQLSRCFEKLTPNLQSLPMAPGLERKFKRLPQKDFSEKGLKKDLKFPISQRFTDSTTHNTRSVTFLLLEHFGSSAHQSKQLHCGQAPDSGREHIDFGRNRDHATFSLQPMLRRCHCLLMLCVCMFESFN